MISFILIFIITIVLYFHIIFQLKTSNDLEVYRLNFPSKQQLDDLVLLKQPFQFPFEKPELTKITSLSHVMEHYHAYDMNVKNVDSIVSNTLYTPLHAGETVQLLKRDISGSYFTCNNNNFVKETGLNDMIHKYDTFLRPSLLSTTMYDYWIGAERRHSPLRYVITDNNFLMVSQGEVTVTLVPPKYSSYLRTHVDHYYQEFFSPVSLTNPSIEDGENVAKIQYVKTICKPGDILYIPPYWYHSLEYKTISSVVWIHYQTYMNVIATIPNKILNLLSRYKIYHEHSSGLRQPETNDTEVNTEVNTETNKNMDSEPLNNADATELDTKTDIIPSTPGEKNSQNVITSNEIEIKSEKNNDN